MKNYVYSVANFSEDMLSRSKQQNCGEHELRIDNGDLEHMCTWLCVFSDILAIQY